MSKQALSEFRTKLDQDAKLREEMSRAIVTGAAESSTERVVAFAKAQGYEFTADELAELNDEELDSVAGGLSCASGEHFKTAILTVRG
jgi:predicted ribosomally synthesized peptide with nif11-like leader